MPRGSPHTWTGWPIRRLMLAVALASATAWGGHASASSVAGSPAWNAETHAHYCKCPRCRGASCCCKPDAAKAPPSTVPARASTIGRDGPCVNSDPCGDPASPTSPPTGPLGKAATLGPRPGPIDPANGRLLIPSARCTPPPRRASRLDDPPERPALA